jgi:hypothetical protein
MSKYRDESGRLTKRAHLTVAIPIFAGGILSAVVVGIVTGRFLPAMLAAIIYGAVVTIGGGIAAVVLDRRDSQST